MKGGGDRKSMCIKEETRRCVLRYLGRNGYLSIFTSSGLGEPAIVTDICSSIAYWVLPPSSRISMASTSRTMTHTHQVLDRGERIELLVDKTDHLQNDAFRFRKAGRALKRQLWLNNLRTMGAMAIVVIIIIWFLVSGFCGWKLDKC